MGVEHKLKLKKEFEEVKEDYEDLLDKSEIGCICHLHSPCALCSHAGNPANLIENPDAWYHICPDCGTVMKDRGSEFDCPHCGFTTCGSC